MCRCIIVCEKYSLRYGLQLIWPRLSKMSKFMLIGDVFVQRYMSLICVGSVHVFNFASRCKNVCARTDMTLIELFVCPTNQVVA